jgi:hypothetical protein
MNIILTLDIYMFTSWHKDGVLCLVSDEILKVISSFDVNFIVSESIRERKTHAKTCLPH